MTKFTKHGLGLLLITVFLLTSGSVCNPSDSDVKHNITATAGTGGSISPSGTTTVNDGSSLTFTITANTGYSIADVKVDGSSVGAVATYTFTNVTADHVIEATFAVKTVTISDIVGTWKGTFNDTWRQDSTLIHSWEHTFIFSQTGNSINVTSSVVPANITYQTRTATISGNILTITDTLTETESDGVDTKTATFTGTVTGNVINGTFEITKLSSTRPGNTTFGVTVRGNFTITKQ